MDLPPVPPIQPSVRPIQPSVGVVPPGRSRPGVGPGPHAPEETGVGTPVGGEPRVNIEMARSHGILVARVIDLRSGAVISQTPPEQVLEVVAGLIETIRRRELRHAHR